MLVIVRAGVVDVRRCGAARRPAAEVAAGCQQLIVRPEIGHTLEQPKARSVPEDLVALADIAAEIPAGRQGGIRGSVQDGTARRWNSCSPI